MNGPDSERAWPMYRALVGVGMVCGLLIAVVFAGTRPAIEQNRAEALERAVFAVLPGAQRRVTLILMADGRVTSDVEAPGERFDAAFGADGKLVGVAIEASGMGYADTITLLYGYSPASETITGFRVLASRETPGLGDRIEKDPAFLANFAALDVSLDESGRSLRNAIETVKPRAATEPWQIDGITGATISSEAVGEILARSTARWVPLIVENRDEITARGRDEAR
ncbi:MAG: FMN-binding protein [Pseudomonadota bacterium]